MLRSSRFFMKPDYIFICFSLFYLGFFKQHAYFYLISTLYFFSLQGLLRFLNQKFSQYIQYSLYILPFLGGFLSEQFLPYVFQMIMMIIFLNTTVVIRCWTSCLGLLLLACAIKTYQYFGLCQWDQILTVIEFGQSGVFSGDFYLLFKSVFDVVIFPLLLLSFWGLGQVTFAQCISVNIKSYQVVLVVTCYSYLLYMCGISHDLLSLLSLVQESKLVFVYICLVSLFFIYKRYKPQISLHSYVLLSCGFLAMNDEFQLAHGEIYPFLNSSVSFDYFQHYYKSPAQTSFRVAAEPKSLILIYVESLEASYQNQQIFKHDLLKPLNELNYPKISFTRFAQLPNTGWTMAGIIASQCGLPYKFRSAYLGNFVGNHLTSFLGHAYCLSDILHDYGYTNVFLNGSSLDFAGQGLFFKTHHYQESYGFNEWQQHGYTSKDLGFWGLADDDLFAEAKSKLNELIKMGQPFNLTLLTIDTHGVNGRLSRSCLKRGGQSFEDIVECSSQEVANFVHYIASQGWLDKVVIVVTGDHLVMNNALSDQLKQSPQHYIYNLFISPKPLRKSRESIVHFDLLPSMLQALGFSWGDDRLGLGHSAIGATNPKLKPKQRIAHLRQIILSHSKSYQKLW